MDPAGWLILAAAGTTLRQVDRWWHTRHRPRSAGRSELVALQRSRANDLTPALLLLGQWVSITGWWGLAATTGPVGGLVAALAVAVHFRHLQEISHFAVHGVLARSAPWGNRLAEIAVHHPLGFVPVPLRRKRHVRDHHPNAAVSGTDPNLAELRQAGLLPGIGTARFASALAHPLTVRGLASTLAVLGANLRPSAGSRFRAAAVGLLLGAGYALGGWAVVLFGVVLPRLLLYPQLAWMSLLVEHTWFDPTIRTGPPSTVEAGRCLRLYPRNRALALIASSTWLPYGDLYHYAHSAHPAVRWNYLPALERGLGHPDFTPTGLLLSGSNVVGRHWRALAIPPLPHAAPARAGAQSGAAPH